MFYRSINQSSADLLIIQNEINTRLQTNFVAKNAFVVTYSSVQSFFDRNDMANFQIILSTDSIKSYVTLNYGSCLKILTSTLITEIDYLNSILNLVTLSIVNPCTSSNVNLAGKWIFNVNIF